MERRRWKRRGRERCRERERVGMGGVERHLRRQFYPDKIKKAVLSGHGGVGVYFQHSGGRSRRIPEFQASLVYIARSRPVRAT